VLSHIPFGVLQGLAARDCHGTPPLDPEALTCWLSTALALHIEVTDELPSHITAAYSGCDEAETGVKGIIVHRPGLRWLRWILAHEAGHALTNTTAGFFLWHDGRYHANLPAERAANACAAMLLLDIVAIRAAFFAGQTIGQIADAHAVPPDAIELRVRLAAVLGEGSTPALRRHASRLARKGPAPCLTPPPTPVPPTPRD
jgi:hypothetical protein